MIMKIIDYQFTSPFKYQVFCFIKKVLSLTYHINSYILSFKVVNDAVGQIIFPYAAEGMLLLILFNTCSVYLLTCVFCPIDNFSFKLPPPTMCQFFSIKDV